MTWNACIVRIQRKGKTESFLVNGDKLTVGRSPECDFVVADNQISRKHLGILIRSGQIYIKDLNSANGSKMGSTQIPSDNVIPYQFGQPLRLGTADLSLQLELLDRKIDSKNLVDGELSEEESQKVRYFIETANARYKKTHDEYEQVVKDFKEYAKAETERLLSEAQTQALQIKTKAEAEVEAKHLEAEATHKNLIEKAHETHAHLVQQAQLKIDALELAQKVEAEQKAQLILTDATAQLERLKSETELTLQQAKAQSESLTQQTLAEAKALALQLTRDAEVQAEKIKTEAHLQVEILKTDAETAAQKLTSESQIKAQRIVSEAEAAALKALSEANQNALSTTKNAESKSHQLALESESTAQRLLKDVHLQVDSLYEKFEQYKKDETQRLQKEHEQYKAKILLESQLEQEKHKETYEIKTRVFEEECVVRRKQLDRDLIHLEERLKALGLDEASALKRVELQEKANQELLKSQQALQLETAKATKSFEELQLQLMQKQQGLHDLQAQKSGVESEISEAIKVRESENEKIHTLRRQIKEEKAHLDREIQEGRGRIQAELAEVRDKESRDIQRMRIDELEKIEALRNKATEEIVQNKSMFKLKLSEKLQGLFVALHQQKSEDLELSALKTEIFNMVQSAVEEQSYELTQSHEGDIQHLVKQETQKRKSTVKRWGVIAASVAAAAAGFYVYNGGNFSHVLLGQNSQGESAAEEFGRQQREQRDSKKFEPPQSDFIKSNYTDNVLYTRNYFAAYTQPQNQEQWISLLNGLFAKEFNLEDDAIVKFVAAESTLVTKLQQEKDQVIPDFAQIGIDKMRKVEKESTEQLKKILKEPSRMRKFQSISEKFWHEKIQERLPASN